MKTMGRFLRFVSVSGILGMNLIFFQNCSPVPEGAMQSKSSSESNAKNSISLASSIPSLGNGIQYAGEADNRPFCTEPGVVDPSCIYVDPDERTCTFNGVVIGHNASITAYQSSNVSSGESCIQETRVCNNGTLSGSYSFSNCTVAPSQNCSFNGQTVAHRQSVYAFQNSSVPYGGSCIRELRTCSNGALSGSFSFSSCEVGAPAACLFDGKTIAHDGSVKAYLNSSVAFGGTCTEETRTCANGILSGSYAFASCDVGAPASCLFNGQTVAHGAAISAFQTSSVGFGKTCVQESRTCNNGALSGSYAFAACEPEAPVSCLFNGQTIAHNQSVTAFLTSKAPFGENCLDEPRTCNNGVLSGTYAYASCTTNEPKSCLFDGKTIAHNQTVVAYLNSGVAFGASCDQEVRTCKDGVLSGSYNFGSCSVAQPLSCSFNGQTVAHGAAVPAFQNSTVEFGKSCVQEARTCSNGVLSGSFSFASCSVNGPAACEFNGRTINHNDEVVAFQNSTVEFGKSCVQETRSCINGSLSGSFAFASCQVNAPASCLFDGKTIAHDQEIVAFQNSSVGFGEACVEQKRTCSNGVLSGSFGFSSCAVNNPLSCEFNGKNIAHNEVVKAFQNSSVAFGKICIEENRTCQNGVLSGSYSFGNCEVGQPASCQFDGKTLAHGQSVEAFLNSTAPFGELCSSEPRVCSNGVLSGTYNYSSCSINQPKSCLFDGKTVAHGEVVKSFMSSTVPFGQVCKEEARKCDNGTLQGSYSFANCSVGAPASCLFNGQSLAHGESIKAFLNSNAPFGNTCAEETRTCSNGVLSGSYAFGSCNIDAPMSCLFDGKTVAHGQEVSAFKESSVGFGQTCSQEVRRCENGLLSGSFTKPSCEVGAPLTCQFNGQTVAHGAKVTGYKTSTVSYGSSCESESRTCTNGVLSGGYQFANCQPNQPASCLFNGQTIAHNQVVVAFKTAAVDAGKLCESENRTCVNGTLSGAFTQISCVINPPKDDEECVEQDDDDNSGHHGNHGHHGRGSYHHGQHSGHHGSWSHGGGRSHHGGSCHDKKPLICKKKEQPKHECKDKHHGKKGHKCDLHPKVPVVRCDIKGIKSVSLASSSSWEIYHNNEATATRVCKDLMGEDAQVVSKSKTNELHKLSPLTVVKSWSGSGWNLSTLSTYNKKERRSCGVGERKSEDYEIEIIKDLNCKCE